MKQRWIQAALSGFVCVLWSGCLPTQPAIQAGDPRPKDDQSSGSRVSANGSRVQATASSKHSVSFVTDTVEPRIAELVERTMEQLSQTCPDRLAAARNLAARVKNAEQKGVPPKVNVRPNPTAFRQEEVSDRGETLRVTGPSGDLCAAISISPQLAVTALHCVRNLCEIPFAKVPASPLGCKVAFELPSGPFGDATVVSTSETDLLALLELQQPLPKSGSLYCDNPRARDRVYTVSHPGGEKWLVSYGWLTRDPILLEWVAGEATRVLVAEIPTKPGSSGGGLFDAHDRVVGVQIARWSPWTTDFGKAAFIQSSRIFSLAGSYCMKHGSGACVGLRCTSGNYDIWEYEQKSSKSPTAQLPYTRAPYLSL